jgi:plasmid replication initiation protein
MSDWRYMDTNIYPKISYDKSNGRWKARVKEGPKWISAGYYDTAELAHAAVLDMSRTPAKAEKIVERTEPLLPANHEDLVKRARRKRTIAKHNLLVETSTTKTLLEAKVFALMLRSVHKEDVEPPVAVIPLEDLFPIGSFGGRQRQLLEDAMVRLMQASIRIPKLNEEDFHLVSLCDSIRLDSEKGLLVASFGRAVLPYIVNLVGDFTTADVDELLQLKSHNSHTFYWLLRCWQFRSPRTVTVERLRALTVGDGYSQYADFRNKVLKPSIQELNDLSFDITYNEKKYRGRTVVSIEFAIGKKDIEMEETKTVMVSYDLKPLSYFELQQKVQIRLQKLKLTEVQIQRVVKLMDTEAELTKLLKETHPLLRDFEMGDKPIDNVAAKAVALLKSTFPQIWRDK